MLLRPFAKINRDLRILGRRPDGYHELRTVLQTIDWCDEISIEPASGFEFRALGGPEDETNLVVRAVRAFEALTGRRVAARIDLVKHIPSGAGLGGGSADAAVTMLGLQRLYDVEIDPADLLESLRGLGSDVPFFAVGGRAAGVGRGEEVIPLEDTPESWFVVVVPPVAIASAEAYSWLTVPPKTHSIMGFCAQFLPGWEGQTRNDFEGVVFSRYPVLPRIRDELLGLGAVQAALSGSGAAVFGEFCAESEAENAAAALRSYGNVRVTKPLPRSEYFRRIISI